MTSARSRNRRGFGVAPVLYLLGLIGVAGGVLFSNYMQTVKSGIGIQNSLTVRNDLMGASAILAGQAVFSSDSNLLCPPRSVHQTGGDPCAAVSIGLLQFQDFPNVQNLPTNYANAGMTGLPVEVGVFAAGAGLKQLDAYGHTYIYCRWENSRANPSLPAFVLLSAGPDGILQTSCGDVVARGDDSYISFPVAEAISHASLWQPDGSTNVSYGATGSKVTIDNNGNLTAAGSINAASAAITNGITAGSITVTGDIAGKDLIASAEVSGATGAFTGLSASSATIANNLSAATLTATGDVSGKDFIASAAISGATGSFTTLNASTAAITNGLTAGSVTASGAIIGSSGAITNSLTAANLTASNIVTSAVGNFTTLNASNAVVTGSSSLGAATASSFVDTGTASIAGALSGSTAIFQGNVTAGSFTLSGSAALSGGVTISGGPLTAGTTSLGTTTVSGFTDTGNVWVGGTLTVQGNTSLNSGLNVNGVAILNNLVGVGTTSPSFPLTVYGALDGNPYAEFGIINTVDTGYTEMAFSGTGYTYFVGVGNAAEGNIGVANKWYVYDPQESLMRLVIDASGNVGIGTTMPDAALQVVSPTTTAASLTWGAVAGTILRSEASELAFGLYNTSPYDYYIQGRTNMNYARDIVLQPLGGNVGIGTTNPIAPLQIGTNIIFGQNNPGGSDQFVIGNTTGSAYLYGYSTASDSASIGAYGVSSGLTLVLNPGGGNVGIGTETPAGMLDVNGYMHLKKYTGAPATCNAALDGNIALSANYTLCVCKSGTGWVTTSTGSTSCTW